MNSNITRVRFSDEATWKKGEASNDAFKIIDERELALEEYWFCWDKVGDGGHDNRKFITHLKALLSLTCVNDDDLKIGKSSNGDSIVVTSEKNQFSKRRIRLIKDKDGKGVTLYYDDHKIEFFVKKKRICHMCHTLLKLLVLMASRRYIGTLERIMNIG